MPNTYSQIYLHYVFSPKYRQALIKAEFEEELYKYIAGIIKNLDQQLIRINGMPDHCHLKKNISWNSFRTEHFVPTELIAISFYKV